MNTHTITLELIAIDDDSVVFQSAVFPSGSASVRQGDEIALRDGLTLCVTEIAPEVVTIDGAGFFVPHRVIVGGRLKIEYTIDVPLVST